MKWTVHLNGEGCYWWIAKTPIGPFYVSSEPESFRTVYVEWYPFDTNGDPEKIATVESEDAGKAAAEEYVKALARKLKRWLK